MGINTSQTTTAADYKPELGAHALVDLTFRGRPYLAGEGFDLKDLPQDKIQEMWRARRIAFGPPSTKLAARFAVTSKARDKAKADKAKADKEAKDKAAIANTK